jgi:hypothetical protein
MANIASFPLVVSILGDGVATSVVVGLGYTPTSATLVVAYDANYNSVSANISSVVAGSFKVTINFVAAFSGTILVELALTSATAYTSAEIQPVTGTVTASKTPQTPAAPAQVSVAVTTTSVLAANASRTGLVLTNLSNGVISIGLGAPAVLDSGISLTPNGVWVMDAFTFVTTTINAIAQFAGSTLAIEELS